MVHIQILLLENTGIMVQDTLFLIIFLSLFPSFTFIFQDCKTLKLCDIAFVS